MILGVLLTIGAAFVYDSGTGRAANGLIVTSAEGQAPIVNWDVVSHDWDGMKLRLRDVAADVEKGWKRITSEAFDARFGGYDVSCAVTVNDGCHIDEKAVQMKCLFGYGEIDKQPSPAVITALSQPGHRL